MKQLAGGGQHTADGWSLTSVIPAWRRAIHTAFRLLPVCAVVVSPVATAQVMNDPTRPPAGIYAPEADGAAGGPVLQSVRISRTERSAIISGELVKLGAKYRDARVTRITENEVELRSAGGIEMLRMYPGVEMKQVVAAPPADSKPAAKKRSPAANTRRKQE